MSPLLECTSGTFGVFGKAGIATCITCGEDHRFHQILKGMVPKKVNQECCLSGIGQVSSHFSFNSQSFLKAKFSKATC